MVSPQNATAPVKEGDVLAAKYRIEGVIGVGGMGVVVSAMHLELEQRVALKFLLPQAATNDELVGRFVREARASVKLKGTHVAKVLDVGRMDDGRAYIVMEYLDGRDLGAELKASTEPFAIEDAVSWILQACEGLAEAHALGIVHRDLKPGNLFLTRGLDGRSLVKVLDFGISKSINPNSSDMLSLTKTEMLLGSPLYMAPEQMRSSKYVDERSDIWALGAIAYELLARRVPFEADTLLDLCFKVAQEGCRAVHEVRPEIPLELSDVVMRCLEKDPQARWLDIGELATALEPFATPADRGSAARTMGILAEGNRARTRTTDPNARSSQPSFPALGESSDSKRISDVKRTTDPRTKTDPNGSGATPKHISPEHVITGTAATERASVADAPVVPDDSSAPDAVPASSAWGTTNAAELGKKKSRRGLIAVGGVAIAIAGVAFALGRGSPPTTPDVATTSGAASSSLPALREAPPEPPPSAAPPVSATPVEPEPPASGSVAPTRPPPSTTTRPGATVAPAPRPKASASASAAPPPVKPPEPATSSGFIRERE
ncbi:MAG: protein kinase [Labilithrix sp.]|nr:protein kinase [Labilithrix sp.]